MTFKCGFFYLIWKLCIHRPSQGFNWFTEFDFLISCWIFEYSSRGKVSCIVNFIANGFYKSQKERNKKVYPLPIRPIHWGFGSTSWKRDNIIERNTLIGRNYCEVFICVEFWPPRNCFVEKRIQDWGYTFWFLSLWDL